MKNKLHKVLILSCLAWNTVPAQEKVKEASTETILVTATKTLTEAREIGKSFTVITRKEIERSNHRDIVDVLRRVAGINIAKNGPHGSSAIIIRGNESYYTKVLLNGIALSDASGTQSSYTTLVNSLNLDNVERIEVIKGPQSTLYGSDAIGGVINIITKKGKGELFGGSLRQEFGKDKFRKSSLTLNGAEKGFSYSLSLSQESQDAISATNEGANNIFVNDDDFYRSTNGTMNLSYQVNDYLKFGLAGHYSKADIEFDDSFLPSSENYLQNSTIRPSVSLMNLLDNRLDIEFSYSHTDTRRTGDYDFFSQTRSYEMFNTLELTDWNLLNFGVEIKKETSYSSTSPNVRSTRYNEFYVQDQFNFDERYFLAIGGRYSDHSSFGSHITYQIAPAIYLEETGTKLHASFGTAYRAPSHYELFEPATVYGLTLFTGGDPNFKPETSEAFDIGFDQELLEGKLKFGITYFYVESKDKIAYVTTDPITSSGGYEQIGFARSSGVESYVQYQFTEDFFGKLVYTRTHTEYELPAGDFRAARVPKDAVSLLLNWQAHEKLNIDLECSFIGNRFSDTNNNNALDSYTLVDLSATYDVSENFKIFAKVSNLFNEKYQLVEGYNTYGRALYGGLEFKF